MDLSLLFRIAADSRIALRPLFAWQAETSAATPGGVSSVAHQFLRCVLHQLAPYGVFVQLFQTKFPGHNYLKRLRLCISTIS